MASDSLGMEPVPPSAPEEDADDFASVHSHLLSLLGRPLISDTSESTFVLPPVDTDEITAVSSQPIAHRPSRPSHSAPLGPLPIPGLEPAVNLWLTSHGIPLSEISTGAALCAAVAHPTPRYLRRRLRVFRTAARMLDLHADDIPREHDLRLHRAWPRVLYALAFVAAGGDPDGWASAAEQAGFEMPAAGGWRACVMGETWDGDDVVRAMAAAHDMEKCIVVVAGTQGSGKTATVARLLQRVGAAQSHVLSCVRHGMEMGQDDQEHERKLRHLRALYFPTVPVEVDVPYASAEVDRTHVKVDGRTVSFVELPSMETSMNYHDGVGAEVLSQYGTFEDVVAEIQCEPADYVILVERLDDLDEKRFRRFVRRLQRIYGKHVLSRTIVVLTHGQELPPADLSYGVWVFDRMRVVKDVLQKLHGQNRPMQIPVVVFENSDNCRRDEASGRLVLPDGTDFLERFLEEFGGLVKRNTASAPLNPIPTKKWWEDYVVMGGIALMLFRML